MSDTSSGAATEARRERFRVSGMRCAACANTIADAVQAVPGVRAAVVNFATGQLAVDWEAGAAADPGLVTRSVQQAGYEASADSATAAATASAPAPDERRAAAREWMVLGISGLLAALVLILDVAGFAHGGGGWIAAAATAGVLALSGAPFFRGAWAATRRGKTNMDTLVALGTGVAFVYGVAVLAGIAPGHAGHFLHAAALLLVFVHLGQVLEHRARRRATDALRALLVLQPAVARVERGADAIEVPATEVRAGEVVRIRTGEALPVDGVVVEGHAAVDEAMLTGESVPVEKGPGDAVLGGTVARSGTLRVRATGVGADTAVARLTRLVEEAQASRAPIQRFADAVSAWFVPAVVASAATTALAWLALTAEPGTAVSRAVAVLVVACPCALGLATPVAILVGSTVGLRRGILVKDAAALEIVGRVRTVAFDKTGTLTTGRAEVADVATAPGVTAAEAWAAAGPLAAASAHPLARSIAATARARGVTGEARSAREIPGRGITGAVAGAEVALGNARLLAAEAPNALAVLEPLAAAMALRGRTPVLCAQDGAPIAVFGLADPAKPSAAATVAVLRTLGIRPVLLSGDREPVVAALAQAVGVTDWRAALTPAEKVEAVAALGDAGGGPVAMVGDGINDAPALARADVGIAVGSGTDAAKETGGLVLVRDDLGDVVRAVRLGRATLRTIRQNLFWALAYNVAMVPAAAGVLIPVGLPALDPALAGLAMALSSISVVLNSLWLGRVRLDDVASTSR